MKANVEDRGIKGDCTPLMEAASGGYVDIVKLLISHGADVNAQSSAGKYGKHVHFQMTQEICFDSRILKNTNHLYRIKYSFCVYDLTKLK